jgi:hypothetical protein
MFAVLELVQRPHDCFVVRNTVSNRQVAGSSPAVGSIQKARRIGLFILLSLEPTLGAGAAVLSDSARGSISERSTSFARIVFVRFCFTWAALVRRAQPYL